MNELDSTRITPLLLQREAAFVTVWECEERIRRLLRGAAFPFPPPPPLPSQRHARPAAARAAPPTGPTVRALKPGEDAYRLTYRQGEAQSLTLTEDLDVVSALCAAATTPALAILRLDTVRLDEAGADTQIECLWQALPAEPPAAAADPARP